MHEPQLHDTLKNVSKLPPKIYENMSDTEHFNTSWVHDDVCRNLFCFVQFQFQCSLFVIFYMVRKQSHVFKIATSTINFRLVQIMIDFSVIVA